MPQRHRSRPVPAEVTAIPCCADCETSNANSTCKFTLAQRRTARDELKISRPLSHSKHAELRAGFFRQINDL